MRQRLLIILGVGIVIVGAAYWYTSRPSEAPRPRRPALPRRVQRPNACQAPSSVKQHLKRNTHSALASKGKGRCKVEVWGSATEEDISCVSVS